MFLARMWDNASLGIKLIDTMKNAWRLNEIEAFDIAKLLFDHLLSSLYSKEQTEVSFILFLKSYVYNNVVQDSMVTKDGMIIKKGK